MAAPKAARVGAMPEASFARLRALIAALSFEGVPSRNSCGWDSEAIAKSREEMTGRAQAVRKNPNQQMSMSDHLDYHLKMQSSILVCIGRYRIPTNRMFPRFQVTASNTETEFRANKQNTTARRTQHERRLSHCHSLAISLVFPDRVTVRPFNKFPSRTICGLDDHPEILPAVGIRSRQLAKHRTFE